MRGFKNYTLNNTIFTLGSKNNNQIMIHIFQIIDSEKIEIAIYPFANVFCLHLQTGKMLIYPDFLK